MSRTQWIIGTRPDCDIVVTHPHVSGHHCQLFDKGSYFLLEDLGSTNGTFVNGTQLTQPIRIERNDSVTLGSHFPMPWPTESKATPQPGGQTNESSDVIPIAFDGRSITVGRSEDCDVTIAFPSISSRHARIFGSGSEILIEDLNSSNGVFVSDQKITGPTAISDQEVFQFGSKSVQLVVSRSATSIGPQSAATRPKSQQRFGYSNRHVWAWAGAAVLFLAICVSILLSNGESLAFAAIEPLKVKHGEPAVFELKLLGFSDGNDLPPLQITPDHTETVTADHFQIEEAPDDHTYRISLPTAFLPETGGTMQFTATLEHEGKTISQQLQLAVAPKPKEQTPFSPRDRLAFLALHHRENSLEPIILLALGTIWDEKHVVFPTQPTRAAYGMLAAEDGDSNDDDSDDWEVVVHYGGRVKIQGPPQHHDESGISVVRIAETPIDSIPSMQFPTNAATAANRAFQNRKLQAQYIGFEQIAALPKNEAIARTHALILNNYDPEILIPDNSEVTLKMVQNELHAQAAHDIEPGGLVFDETLQTLGILIDDLGSIAWADEISDFVNNDD